MLAPGVLIASPGRRGGSGGATCEATLSRLRTLQAEGQRGLPSSPRACLRSPGGSRGPFSSQFHGVSFIWNFI